MIAIIVSVFGLVYLYQHSLGAVSFLIISIFFFYFAYRLVRKKRD